METNKMTMDNIEKNSLAKINNRKIDSKNKFDISNFVYHNMAWIIFAILMVVFTCLSENFLTFRNLISILNQNAYVIVAATGITFIMMSGAIDLSIGYQMAVNGIICSLLLTKYQWPVLLVILVSIVIGCVLSLVNVILSIQLSLPQIFVSLGTMTIYQGIAYVISQSQTISGFPKAFSYLGQGSVGPIPFAIVIMLIFFLIMSFILNRTYFGRYVFALGGNEEAARLAGINVKKVRIMIAIIAGAFVGLATMMLISRIGSTQASTGPGTEFTVLTGVLLGGVSIRGGEGKLSGVLAGILILALLSNGMQLAGMGAYYQFIAKGVIMLAALGFDVYQMNRRRRIKKVSKG